MTQLTETVQTVQTFEELQSVGRKNLVAMMKQFKAEDTDCLSHVNGKSKNEELITALAEYMGLQSVEPEITAEVNKEITEAINSNVDEADVIDFGEDVPTLQASLFSEEVFNSTPQVEVIMVTDAPKDPIIEEIMEREAVTQEEAEEINAEHLADMAEQDADWANQVQANLDKTKEEQPVEGEAEVDDILAELGLDDLTIDTETDFLESEEAVAEAEAENAEFAKLIADETPAEEKPKKKGGRKATIPMDAPIPVRKFQDLLIGVYGNVLEEREEPFPEGHKYEGLVHEEIKLERFNPKAHEAFRNTKGNMHLVYTNVGSTYMIVYKKADGTLEPVLEVANKGRGHLRCKQIANHLHVAYNEKNDQEVISAEQYQKLAEQIELLPINAESVGA